MSCSTTMCFIVKTLLLMNFLGKFNVQSFPTNSVENDEPGDIGTINNIPTLNAQNILLNLEKEISEIFSPGLSWIIREFLL